MSERAHWEGCWRERTHHECAVARCEELERERDALRAKNKELGGIAHAATNALGRLSFECFGLIEPCERPSVATYNSTYATLVECRKRLADAAIDAARAEEESK